MRRDPLRATFIRFPRYHDRLPDNSPEGRSAARAEWAAFLDRARGIDRKTLSDRDAVTLDCLVNELEMHLEGLRRSFEIGFIWQFWDWQVDHIDGPQASIGTVVEVGQPMETELDALALLDRLARVPAFFDNHVEALRSGLERGLVSARVPVEKTIAQLGELMAAPPEASPFGLAAARLPAAARAKREAQLSEAVASKVYPSYRKYRDFLRDEVLPRSRSERIGLDGLPGGPGDYRYCIRYHTSLDLSPEELHRMGLEELAEIEAGVSAIARRAGFVGPVKAFLDHVRTDPKNFFTTREEILSETTELVAGIQSKLSQAFGRLPKTPVVVRASEPHKEKNDVAARYYEPPEDLSRPGVYVINTFEPHTRARFTGPALAAHEAVPGHHLQLAFAVEERSLPAFRRHSVSTAYVEGWALYAEVLAGELGVYSDDLARLGMLAQQAWRAARLVLDTGLHAMGWSRAKAIAFFMEHIPASEAELTSEVDRYTIWPGQALAYTVGKREILALREEARRRGGFDLKKFHDLVLSAGAVPLPVLRKVVLGDDRPE